MRGNGVVTTGNLMDISRFRIGGPDNVRGFPAAELSGDQGVYGSIEFQRQFQLIQKFPVQFSVFYDAGVVHRKDPFAGVKKTESLTSVGMGLSFQLFRHYEFELQSVIPTNSHDVSDGRESVRLWAAVSVNRNMSNSSSPVAVLSP